MLLLFFPELCYTTFQKVGETMTIPENLKHIRKEKGLTQKKLGELCGMSEVMIRQYELGYRKPKFETLEKIAKALDCEVSDIDERVVNGHLTISEPLKKILEAGKLIKKRDLGNPITPEEQQRISEYIAFKEGSDIIFSVNSFFGSDTVMILLDYIGLNKDGKEEAKKRISELTEIPRYTEPNSEDPDTPK